MIIRQRGRVFVGQGSWFSGWWVGNQLLPWDRGFFASVGLKHHTKHSWFGSIWPESLVLCVEELRGEFPTDPSSPMIKTNVGMVAHPCNANSREMESSKSLGLPGNQPHHSVSSRPMRDRVSEDKVRPSRWVKVN